MNARVFERHEPKACPREVCGSVFHAETSQRVSKRRRCQLSCSTRGFAKGRFFVRGSGVLAQRSRNVPSRRLNGRFWNQSSEISLSGSGLFRDRNGSRAWTEAVEPRVRRTRASFPRASALVRPRPTRFVLLASIVCADLLVVSDTWTRQLETCSASLPPPLAFAPR
jgi:hypothetical protein